MVKTTAANSVHDDYRSKDDQGKYVTRYRKHPEDNIKNQLVTSLGMNDVLDITDLSPNSQMASFDDFQRPEIRRRFSVQPKCRDLFSNRLDSISGVIYIFFR